MLQYYSESNILDYFIALCLTIKHDHDKYATTDAFQGSVTIT